MFLLEPYWILTDGWGRALLAAPCFGTAILAVPGFGTAILAAPFVSLLSVLEAGPCFPPGVVTPVSVLETGLCLDSALRSVRRAIE